MLEGQSGIRALDKPFVEEFNSPVRIGGRLLESFDEHLSRVELRRLSYMQKMSTVLGRRLWDNAGSPDVDTKRLMVSIGPALATTEKTCLPVRRLAGRGHAGGDPASSADAHAERARPPRSGWIVDAKAGIIAPVMADASGAAAIAQAWRHIVLGEADIAICGGVETTIEAVPVAAFVQLGHVVDQQRRPGRRLPPVRQEPRRHGVR